MKILEFTIPFNAVTPPYNQLGVLMTLNGGILDTVWGSTVPNVQRPGQPDEDNYKEYPVLAPGWYNSHYEESGHRGKDPALILDNNLPVPIVQTDNPRTGMKKMATNIHVHEGYMDISRGSAGCITLDETQGKLWLRRNFKDDDKVRVFIPSPFPWFNYQDRGDILMLRKEDS